MILDLNRLRSGVANLRASARQHLVRSPWPLFLRFLNFLYPEPTSPSPAAGIGHPRLLQRDWRPDGAAVFSLVVCGVLISQMFHTGIRQGMDGRMYEAIDDATVAIAIAISDQVYGLRKGYVAYRPVMDALQKGGMTKIVPQIEALGRKFPENLRDRALLNSAIQSALVVKPPANANFENRMLVSMVGMDPGVVNYDKLAFRLFGYRVEALYYLYFVMLALGVVTFVLAFSSQPAILGVPILFLAAGNLVVTTDLFENQDLFTVANVRFLSTLGILPALHIATLILLRAKPDAKQLALAFVQTAIFSFAISIRSSLVWAVLLIAVLAALQLFVSIRSGLVTAPFLSLRTGQTALRSGLWPAALLFAGVWGYGAYVSSTMHPSYQLEDFLSHHPRHHNAFMGLTSHPDWNKRFAQRYGGLDGDSLSRRAAVDYFIKHYDGPESYFHSVLGGGDKYRLQDRMARGAYFEFIRKYPRFVIEAHIAKVGALLQRVTQYTYRAISDPSRMNPILALAAVIAAASLCLFDRHADALATAGRLAILSGLFMLFSWLPIIYTYVAYHTFGEPLWTAMLFLFMGTSTASLAVVARFAPAAKVFARPGGQPNPDRMD